MTAETPKPQNKDLEPQPFHLPVIVILSSATRDVLNGLVQDETIKSYRENIAQAHPVTVIDKDDYSQLRKLSEQLAPKSAAIIDDLEIYRTLGTANLDLNGIPVTQFSSAEAFLQQLDPASPPDLIVTDIQMPGGMDGTMLAVQLRKMFPVPKEEQ